MYMLFSFVVGLDFGFALILILGEDFFYSLCSFAETRFYSIPK